MSLFLGNRSTKLYKLEDENMVSKFIKWRKNKENEWEHRSIGQFWKGTREQGPPRRQETPITSLRLNRKKGHMSLFMSWFH